MSGGLQPYRPVPHSNTNRDGTRRKFATDSPLEEAVCCELVSEMELGKSVFWTPTGKLDPFPQAACLSKRLLLLIFFECRYCHGGCTSRLSKKRRLDEVQFVQKLGFLANYGSKPIDIGSLGHDYQSGILWSAYPIKLWALGPPSVSSSDAEKARRNPPTRGTSPPGASDPQEKRGALPVHCKNGNGDLKA